MSIRLVNGSTSVRVKSSEGCAVLACGCAHSDVSWLQLCDAHWFEWSGMHDAARAAHVATLQERLP